MDSSKFIQAAGNSSRNYRYGIGKIRFMAGVALPHGSSASPPKLRYTVEAMESGATASSATATAQLRL